MLAQFCLRNRCILIGSAITPPFCTTIGYLWKQCGCETRGGVTLGNESTCYWAICQKHKSDIRQLTSDGELKPKHLSPENYSLFYLNRADIRATPLRDKILILRDDQLVSVPIESVL